MTIKAKREIIKDVIQIMVNVDYNDNKTFIIALSKVNETYNKRIIPIEEVYEIYDNDEVLDKLSAEIEQETGRPCTDRRLLQRNYEMFTDYRQVQQGRDCCVQLRQNKEIKEPDHSITASFLFGTAFWFASKYDEKEKILKDIREIIDGNEIMKQEPSETIHGSTYGGVSWSETYKPQQTSEDAISRQAVIEYIEGSEAELGHSSENELVCQYIKELPPVNPQPKTGRCKDCKWWKDSDGVYRRGVRAESQCPINRREVFEGTGYCYMYDPQESEVSDAGSN